MSTYRHSRNSINFLFSMLLFLVFILCCIFTILIGSRVYTNIRTRNNDSFYSDTALSYLSNKVRQADRSDGISVEEENGQSILLLRSETDGIVYETRIYEKDGLLLELFAEKGSGLPLDAGTPVSYTHLVGFVMLLLIGNHIHHGKTIGIGHIVYNTAACRIPSGPENQIGHLAFIPFQHPAHIHHKSVVVFRQMAHSAVRFACPPILLPEAGKQLGFRQHRVLRQKARLRKTV